MASNEKIGDPTTKIKNASQPTREERQVALMKKKLARNILKFMEKHLAEGTVINTGTKTAIDLTAEAMKISKEEIRLMVASNPTESKMKGPKQK